MGEIQTNISVNKEDKVISISGIREGVIEIDYSGDIDFTELVEELTKLIDNNNNVNPQAPSDIDDGKTSMVINTITEIIQKYNDSITTVDNNGQASLKVEEEDGLPF